MIDICFWDFQNHAKNGDSVPLKYPGKRVLDIVPEINMILVGDRKIYAPYISLERYLEKYFRQEFQ